MTEKEKIVKNGKISRSSIRWVCGERIDRDRTLVCDHGTCLMILFLGRASYTGFASRGPTLMKFLRGGSRQVKPNCASLANQGAGCAARAFSVSWGSAGR